MLAIDIPALWLQWLAGISLGTFLLGALLMPWLLARLPVDHLRGAPRELVRTHWLLRALKNALGLVLLVAGLVLLYLPGQGVLTMLAGLWLVDLPGKHWLERRLLGRPRVFASINWLRARAGKPPLLPPDAPEIR